jgi:hypothetical protein
MMQWGTCFSGHLTKSCTYISGSISFILFQLSKVKVSILHLFVHRCLVLIEMKVGHVSCANMKYVITVPAQMFQNG